MSRKKGKREAAPVRKGGAGKPSFANRWNKWAKIMVISLCSVLALVVCSLFDCHFFNIGPTIFYAMALAFAENTSNHRN